MGRKQRWNAAAARYQERTAGQIKYRPHGKQKAMARASAELTEHVKVVVNLIHKDGGRATIQYMEYHTQNGYAIAYRCRATINGRSRFITARLARAYNAVEKFWEYIEAMQKEGWTIHERHGNP